MTKVSIDESLNSKAKVLIRSVIEKNGKDTVIEEYLDDCTSMNQEGKQSIITQCELDDLFDDIFPSEQN